MKPWTENVALRVCLLGLTISRLRGGVTHITQGPDISKVTSLQGSLSCCQTCRMSGIWSKYARFLGTSRHRRLHFATDTASATNIESAWMLTDSLPIPSLFKHSGSRNLPTAKGRAGSSDSIRSMLRLGLYTTLSPMGVRVQGCMVCL